jgi:hypothetical protein
MVSFPAGLPGDWPDAETHVVIAVNEVRLGAEALRNPRINKVFVLYEFLPEFCTDADQVCCYVVMFLYYVLVVVIMFRACKARVAGVRKTD